MVAIVLLLLSLLTIEPKRSQAGEPGLVRPVRVVREPVALACIGSGKRLVVANQRSGSVSIIDTVSRRLVAEHNLGHGLADLALVGDGSGLLAVDEVDNRLLWIDAGFSIVSALAVRDGPVRLVVASDGSFCAVASLWSRCVTIIDLVRKQADGAVAMTVRSVVALPFCPREMVLLGDGSKLVVVDAFGGGIAVVDTKRPGVDSVRTLPAHNIGGLAFSLDGKSLIVTHQRLNRLAETSFDDVHWGMLIRNHRRAIRTSVLLTPGSDDALLDGSRLFDIGDVTYAAGDPGRIIHGPTGHWIVALGGVDEIAIGAATEQGSHRIVVGARPSALELSPDGEVVYVANRLDDTVSVVGVATGQNLATIKLGDRPEPTAVERGERLYYSARLAHDSWMSCHSCHTDGHTNGQAADTLGDGSYGAAKQVPSLLGVGKTGPWTWTGSVDRLEEQVQKSITTTMQGTKPTEGEVLDLTAFLRSLPPPRVVRPVGLREDRAESVARGRVVFEKKKCVSCHQPAEYTSGGRYDVGLVDAVGNRTFNPPSLRGVSQRDRFLHDGRSQKLGDVFIKEHHPRGLLLEPSEMSDLLAFLGSL